MVESATNAIEDKQQLIALIMGKSSEDIEVEIPWAITEDWWGIGPIDHAMDTVVDVKDGVNFYDECMIQRMEDSFIISVGFTCAGEDSYDPGDPDDFEDEEEYEEALAEFEESIVCGTLYINLTEKGLYESSEFETD